MGKIETNAGGKTIVFDSENKILELVRVQKMLEQTTPGPQGAQGEKGDNAPEVQIEFSADNTNWHDVFQVGDEYIRFSTDGGSTWSDGIDFVGDDGADGADGDNAPEVMIEYSADNSSWHSTFQSGDLYIRFSTDGGSTWSDGYKFIGEDGEDGIDGTNAPEVMIEYSADNSNWHDTFQTGDEYIRFSTDGGSTWSDGYKFIGDDGEVTGPGSSIDGNLVSFDGTTGKAIKDSGKAPGDFADAGHDHDGVYLKPEDFHEVEVLAFSGTGTATYGYKIYTNIPIGFYMCKLRIDGCQDGYTNSTLALLSWYYYDGDIYMPQYISLAAGDPLTDFYLGVENDKIVIYINDPGYYTRFRICFLNYGSHQPPAGSLDGWTWADEEMGTGYTKATGGSAWHSGNFDPSTKSDVGHDHDTDYAPLTHKSRHAEGGADALTPSDIGASPDTHNHDGTYLKDLIDDPSPELGGGLNCGSKEVYFSEVNDDSVTTINFSSGLKHKKDLSVAGSDVTLTFTDPSGPTNVVLRIVQDSTARTITWPSSVKWVEGAEPSYAETGKTYVFVFYFDGTNYYGTMAGWF